MSHLLQVPDVIASPPSLFDAVKLGDISAVEKVLHLDLNQLDKVLNTSALLGSVHITLYDFAYMIQNSERD